MISLTAVVSAILYIIIAAAVFGLLYWLLNYSKLAPLIPEPFKMVANGILAVASVFILIGILLGLVGHPIFRW